MKESTSGAFFRWILVTVGEGVGMLISVVSTLFTLFASMFLFALSLVFITEHIVVHIPLLPESWMPAVAIILAVVATLVEMLILDVLLIVLLVLFVAVVFGLVSGIAALFKRIAGSGRG